MLGKFFFGLAVFESVASVVSFSVPFPNNNTINSGDKVDYSLYFNLIFTVITSLCFLHIYETSTKLEVNQITDTRHDV